MPLLHSEPEAALLEAGALSHRLAERYRQAVKQLADHSEDAGSPAHRLCSLLDQHADALERQAEQLDQTARSLDLLPREPHTELETLKQLADQVQSLLDDQQGLALAKRFSEEEQVLLSELEQAAQLEPCPESVSRSQSAGRERVAELGSL